jgi:hypothetical protein
MDVEKLCKQVENKLEAMTGWSRREDSEHPFQVADCCVYRDATVAYYKTLRASSKDEHLEVIRYRMRGRPWFAKTAKEARFNTLHMDDHERKMAIAGSDYRLRHEEYLEKKEKSA